MADLVADINDGPLTKKVLALEKLAGDAAQLAAHAGVVAAQLAHSSPMVRQSALDALLRLPPAELTAHADALVEWMYLPGMHGVGSVAPSEQ